MFCSSDQRTALHHAAGFGRTAACQLLIDAKADVNARDKCAFMFEV
jgi:ankyrin repeat protein